MHMVISIGWKRRHALRVVAAALAIAITIGMFSAVIELFQILGLTPGEYAAAERACADRTYVREREACMRQWSGVPYVRTARR